MLLQAAAQFILSEGEGVNETPLKMVVFKVDTPTPFPLSSTGKKVKITRTEARRLIPQFYAKPIYATPNLSGGHKSKEKTVIGVVTGAHIADNNDFIVHGVGYEGDHPGLFAYLRTHQGEVGNSYEFLAAEMREEGDYLVPSMLSVKGVLVAFQSEVANGEMSRLLAASKDVFQVRDGEQFPSSAFLYVPDPEKPSTWKLPYKEMVKGELKVTPASLSRAAMALSKAGFRGQQVDMPEGDRQRMKVKLRQLYRTHTGKVPDKIEKLLAMYTKVADLPTAVKKLSPTQQAVWMRVYNGVYKDYTKAGDKNYDEKKSLSQNRERFASALAWAQVHRTKEEKSTMSASFSERVKGIFNSFLPEHPEKTMEVWEFASSAKELEEDRNSLKQVVASLEQRIEDMETEYLAERNVSEEELTTLTAKLSDLSAQLGKTQAEAEELRAKIKEYEDAVSAAEEEQEEHLAEMVKKLEAISDKVPWSDLLRGKLDEATLTSTSNAFSPAETAMLAAGKEVAENPFRKALKQARETSQGDSQLFRSSFDEALQSIYASLGVTQEVQ